MTLAAEQLERLRLLSDDLERIEDEDHFWSILKAIQTSEEMFYVPWLLNWDDSWTEKAIKWVLDSNLCDAGTALAIYWLACPTDWAGQEIDESGDDWDNDWIAFFRTLERRMRSLEFPSQVIAYDPRVDWKHWNADGSERHDLSGIPECMRRSSPGTKIKSLRELNL
jgi:hypothetical protein